MSTKEVAKALELSSATANLAKLYKYGEVERKKVQVNNHCNYGYMYKIK